MGYRPDEDEKCSGIPFLLKCSSKQTLTLLYYHADTWAKCEVSLTEV